MIEAILQANFPHLDGEQVGKPRKVLATDLAYIVIAVLVWMIAKDRVAALAIYDDPTIVSLLLVPAMLHYGYRTGRTKKLIDAIWISIFVVTIVLGGFVANDVFQHGMKNASQLFVSLSVLLITIPIEIYCTRSILLRCQRYSTATCADL